jgi:hypothetical protein
MLQEARPRFPPFLEPWFLESYDQGILTARQGGKLYKARCEGSRAVSPGHPAWDAPPTFVPCTMVIRLVGRNVNTASAGDDNVPHMSILGGALWLYQSDFAEPFTIVSVAAAPR